jgi:cysteinyl-tRNA synthetase
MDDDLNTSVALSVLFELVRLTNKLLEEGTTAETLSAIDGLFGLLGGDCLGIVQEQYPQTAGLDDQMTDRLIQIFIDQRSEARKLKEFAAGDAIRDKLAEIGIALEDRPDGTTIWRRK